MDIVTRIKELDAKLEREGLTEAEQAEVAHYYSLALLTIRAAAAEAVEQLRQSNTN